MIHSLFYRRLLLFVSLGCLIAFPSIGETSPVFLNFGKTPTARGITESIVDEYLSARINGMISKIHFKEGDAVKKGDVIIEFHKEIEELEVARRKLIWESKLEVESAKDRIETIKLDLEGIRHLFHTTKSISKEKLFEKELEYKTAVADLERLKVGEQQQKIEYKMAVVQLNMRRIRAPIDGVISEIFKYVGENGEPGAPLIRLVDMKTCYFVTNIDATIVYQLKKGQKMKLLIDAGREPIGVNGAIAFISPVVDPASGLQEIKVEFDNSDHKVRPGAAGVIYLEGLAQETSK